MNGEEAKEAARRVVVVEGVEIMRTVYGAAFSDECPSCGERTTNRDVCVHCGGFIRDLWAGKEE